MSCYRHLANKFSKLISESPLANLCHVSILPPSWRQKRYCLLYIMGRARKYVVVWQNGPGWKSAGPCHLYTKGIQLRAVIHRNILPAYTHCCVYLLSQWCSGSYCCISNAPISVVCAAYCQTFFFLLKNIASGGV